MMSQLLLQYFSPMKFLLILLSLAIVGSHAMSPEVYWQSVLPNSPMPKAIKDLLYIKEWDDGKRKVSTPSTSMIIKLKHQPEQSSLYGVSKDALKDHIDDGFTSRQHERPKDQQKFNRVAKSLLFLEHDLHQGKEMTLQFKKHGQTTTYDKFSAKHDLMEAETMKKKHSLCDHIEGDDAVCATSVESMTDFGTKKLGKNVKGLSTVVNAKESTPLQKYEVEFVRKLEPNNAVICHKKEFAFMCHISDLTRSYVVSLAGADGTKVKAVAACHYDTSKWDPKRSVFQLLNVTPGTSPICHFLHEGDILWVPY